MHCWLGLSGVRVLAKATSECIKRRKVNFYDCACMYVHEAAAAAATTTTATAAEPAAATALVYYHAEKQRQQQRRGVYAAFFGFISAPARDETATTKTTIPKLHKINDGFNINCTNEPGLAHFHVACKYGYKNIAEKFLELGQEPNLLVQSTGDSPLHLALLGGCKEVIELLLRRGADPNLINNKGLTPLQIICNEYNDYDLAKMVFELSHYKYRPVQVNLQDNFGDTLLHVALSRNHKNLFGLLLKYGADPNLANANGFTPLLIILNLYNDYDLAEMLFELSHDKYKPLLVNAQDKFGNTLIHVTLSRGHKNFFELLLRNGANPNLPNAKGLTPLQIICKDVQDNLDWLQMLFELSQCKPVQVNVQDDKGNTPLLLALRSTCCKKKEVVELLLKNGSDPNLADDKGWTPLVIICNDDRDDFNLAKMLFDLSHDQFQPVQVNFQDHAGNTPLHVALYRGRRNLFEILLRNGANPNLANAKGLTPLQIICCRNRDDYKLAKMIFELSHERYRPVKVNVQDKAGQTPLHDAMLFGHRNLVQVLLKNDANPNSVNIMGLTPLHMICTEQYYDRLAQIFFEVNDAKHQLVKVNVQNKLGNAPLHFALHLRNERLIELLLRRGADPNLTDEKGLTPLHIICNDRYSDHKMAEIFFKINQVNQLVQVDARDKLGRTPLQIAVANFKPELVNLLLDRGADISSFVFPSESYFSERLKRYKKKFSLELVTSALAVIESLQKRGYELKGSDALTIIKLFSKLKLFEKSSDVEEFCYDDERFVREANKIMIIPSLSLYDLIQLQPEEDEKIITFMDYWKFWCSDIRENTVHQDRTGTHTTQRDYEGQLPNLRDIFRPQAIDWLLTESVKDVDGKVIKPKPLMDFIISTGYKDEPIIDEDGKPLIYRTTPVHQAHIEWVLAKDYLPDLFEIYRFDVNYTDDNGLTHFHVACEHGLDDVVKKFLEFDQDPNLVQKTVEGQEEEKEEEEDVNPPLHSALCWSHKKVVELLLKNGADPNLVNAKGFTPLHIICNDSYGNHKIPELFFKINDELNQLVQVDARDKLGRTPLQWAVASFLPDVVDVLLNRGADLSSFVFPSESHFDEGVGSRYYISDPNYKLILVPGALAVVECLEKRGYQMKRSDALTLMAVFDRHGFFEKLADCDEYWYDDEEGCTVTRRVPMRAPGSVDLQSKTAARRASCLERRVCTRELYVQHKERDNCEARPIHVESEALAFAARLFIFRRVLARPITMVRTYLGKVRIASRYTYIILYILLRVDWRLGSSSFVYYYYYSRARRQIGNAAWCSAVRVWRLGTRGNRPSVYYTHTIAAAAPVYCRRVDLFE
ncbi:unnamed protein product [Trichogramma brassicae]|uniref:Uncharacterized protein n=1 Tax=Trichogramma brassicae TaxID=86971 RepID=A0A6H5I4E1_9HYME|nr:unnamed protein product [Trichogramma brassicae]